jgi:hypothetical protein
MKYHLAIAFIVPLLEQLICAQAKDSKNHLSTLFPSNSSKREPGGICPPTSVRASLVAIRSFIISQQFFHSFRSFRSVVRSVRFDKGTEIVVILMMRDRRCTQL